jgi:serine/threonine-protein kinase
MGAVLRARDVKLGRELAVKVLLEHLRDRHEMIHRFVEEAQIGGQLQHPGIVPVYELGQTSEGRPYFTMKLIRGQTLSQLLKERTNPNQDLPRFLRIFDQICQTLAYVHARRVIHRDLKPLNIMVGSFGEVQVMDWGLAKVLGQPDTATPSEEVNEPSEVRTMRTNSPDMASRTGAVFGTYAYMAPEQARGETGTLDERCDVFGLGAILCEILTGLPPYSSQKGNLHAQASEANLEPALSLLENSQADPELVRLAKSCLSPSRENRPRDAGEVARQVTAHLTGVQERLRTAELERAAAEARVEEAKAKARAERKARRLTAVLGSACLGLVILGLSAFSWLQQRWSGTETALNEVQSQLEDGQWARARETLERAQGLVILGRSGLRQRIAEYSEDLEWINEIEQIRIEQSNVANGSFDSRSASARYEQSFENHGIKILVMDLAEVAERINRRAIRAPLLAALDDWIFVAPDPKLKTKVFEIVSSIDSNPDSISNQLRQAYSKDDIKRIGEIVQGENQNPLHPNSLKLGAGILTFQGKPEQAVDMLRKAQKRFPDDFWINLGLAHAAAKCNPPIWDEAIRYYSVALALRGNSPGVHNNLGLALRARERFKEAFEAFQKAIELKSDYAQAHFNLGLAYDDLKKPQDAIAEYNKAIELDPEYGDPHLILGESLIAFMKIDEGKKAFEHGVALKAATANHFRRFGRALEKSGLLADALNAYKKSVELDPHFSEAFNSIGSLLSQLKQHKESIAAHKQAILANPANEIAHYNLGNAYAANGSINEAIKSYRSAIKIKPDYPEALNNLGIALHAQNRLAEALESYQIALYVKPTHATARYGTAEVYRDMGKSRQAEEAYRKATELDPLYAEAFCNWGQHLKRNGRFAEALEKLKHGHEIGSKRPNWGAPSPRWIREAESYLALEKRLPMLLEGKDLPQTPGEWNDLTIMCAYKRIHGEAAHFFEKMFSQQPKLLDDLGHGYRYNGACAATLAGFGKGELQDKLDDKERLRLRNLALDWLRADLASLSKLIKSINPKSRVAALRSVQHWLEDPDLAGPRDSSSLLLLPEEERAKWASLWKEIAELVKKADEKADS